MRKLIPGQEGAEDLVDDTGNNQGIKLPAYDTQGKMWQEALNSWEKENGTSWRK
jgi:hypothetical protein